MSYTEKVKQLAEGAMVQTPMPRYQCHKKVWALKIAAIETVKPNIEELDAILNSTENGSPDKVLGAVITPTENGYGAFGVSQDFMRKHEPQVGGYYVVYDDGYKSFSPAQAFEEGYTRL